jgi:hypothetical protein
LGQGSGKNWFRDGFGSDPEVTPMRIAWKADSGSIAPLGIGLAALSLASILIFSSLSSMFLLQRRLTTLAEFAALSGARYGLSAQDFLVESRVDAMPGLRITSDSVVDEVTRQVTICAMWRTPLPTNIKLPDVEICGTGAARAG